MKNVLILAIAAFAVTLAIVVGNRMSAEAFAVVVGIVCGVAASIPMSVLILILTNRLGRREPVEGERSPVIIISPAEAKSQYLPRPMPSSHVVDTTPRRFEVIGGEEGSRDRV